MLPSPLAALLTPKRFFAESDRGTDLTAAVAVVTAVAVVMTLAAALIGQFFANAIEATVTVDNPDRPPEPFCQEPVLETHEDACEEPETIERDADAILWEVWTGFLPWVFVGIYLFWIVAGLFIHAAVRLTGGEGSVTDTLAVFGWAIPAELLQAAGAVGFFWWLTAGETVTASTEAQLIAETEALVATIPEINPLVFIVAAWQIAILAYGLSESHDVSPATAAAASGIVVGIAALLAM